MEENVWQEVFWINGTIECDHPSQEGPEYHKDMQIPFKRNGEKAMDKLHDINPISIHNNA